MARLIREQGDTRITVNALNPGAMSDTSFSRPVGNVLVRTAVHLLGTLMGALIGTASTAPVSGAVLASLITQSAFANVTGTHIDRGTTATSSPLSYDRDNAAELWRASSTMTALATAHTIFTLTILKPAPRSTDRRTPASPSPHASGHLPTEPT